MSIRTVVNEISSVHLDNVFNPYKDVCPHYDLTDAPKIRRQNLTKYLSLIEQSDNKTLWMGRDLGYRGGRRTGLALTDEFHLDKFHHVFEVGMKKSTKGAAFKERTATEIWSLLFQLPITPLLWNVFPFHPHEPDNPMSNRKFSAKELRLAEEINYSLIRELGIQEIIAIGNDAESYSKRFGLKVTKVRHPSYGGVKDFRKGITSYYSYLLSTV